MKAVLILPKCVKTPANQDTWYINKKHEWSIVLSLDQV